MPIRLKKFMRLVLLGGVVVGSLMAITAPVRADDSRISVLQIQGVINPVIANYIERGLNEAAQDGVEVCIIRLDTPGGLDTSMRDIVQDIVNSQVPVVVYVSPQGARAASAGVFITMSAHIAAMSPQTNIGAAHPVSIGEDGEAQMSDEMAEKVVNDASAYIRSIADAHNRNIDWAERAVRESVSITEAEALELNVIDMVAPDLDTLIDRLHGQSVTMVDGREIVLDTRGGAVSESPMSAVEDFLLSISDPNIAVVLLSLAVLGITVEIFNPGLFFPGIFGGIAAFLATYSLGILPINHAGIALVVLAGGLFVAEFFTASFGIFTAGGIASLVIGLLILFSGRPSLFQPDPWVIPTIAAVIGTVAGLIIWRVVRTHRLQPTTGREELKGKSALVKTPLNPEGTVFYNGELWTAVLDAGEAKPGEEVIITRTVGLKLLVSKKNAA